MMDYPTSFHSRFGQYLVELELKELAQRNPCLGFDDGKPINWLTLLDQPPSFFPNTLRRGPSPLSADLPVAIIGGGVAGLRVAMMLEALDIPYKLFEASERYGGRAFTYHFKKENGEVSTTQNYFDVGAMRFPKNAVNASTYELFEELDITDQGGKGGKLIPYSLQSPNNILLFNGIWKSVKEVSEKPGGDHFNDGVNKGGRVPEQYIKMKYQKHDGTILHGVDACLEAAYGPFKVALALNWDEGWKRLMVYDHHSIRSYMIDVMKYPWPVVLWMERTDSGTAGFDHLGFAEGVLESLEFDYPTGVVQDTQTQGIEWRCIEGGTETLAKAMYNSLKNKENIQTRMQVTSIAKIKRPVVDLTYKQPAEIKVADHTFNRPAGNHTDMVVAVEDDISEYSHYDQEVALRSLHYGPAVKVGIKFKSRWWQDSNPGGSSKTDRQSRVVVYPSYGLDGAETTPGVLMATYNWHQDAFRYGSLIEAKDWSKVLDPNRKRPASEEFLLKQIFTDLSKLHGRDPSWYKEQMVDHYAYDWYHNPFTMGAYASFGPGQFKNLYPSISKPASDGYLHFGGEVASYHHGWIAGALDSAWRCVYEIVAKDGTDAQKDLFAKKYGKKRKEFDDVNTAVGQYYRGIYANSLEKPGGNDGPFKY